MERAALESREGAEAGEAAEAGVLDVGRNTADASILGDAWEHGLQSLVTDCDSLNVGSFPCDVNPRNVRTHPSAPCVTPT